MTWAMLLFALLVLSSGFRRLCAVLIIVALLFAAIGAGIGPP